MTQEEKAKIVAWAKLLGAEGEDEEILNRYCGFYDTAMKSFMPPPPVPPDRLPKAVAMGN